MVFSSVADWIYHAVRWTWHDADGYNFISGPLADITLLGGGYAVARHHNCHVKGCWRIARAQVPGTNYIICRKHHPHQQPTAQRVLDDHAAAVKAHSTAPPDAPGGGSAGSVAG